jgi:hypothetical protein
MLLKLFLQLKSLSFYEYFLLIIPLFQIFGPLFLNVILIFSGIFFIYEFYNKKNFLTQIKVSWVFFYLVFFFYNCIRAFYSHGNLHALQSSISQIRFLLFSLFIFLCVPRIKNIKFIIDSWLVIILITAFDVLYQYWFGIDIFGFAMNGQKNSFARPSGFFAESLRAGAFITFIAVPIISYYYSKFNSLTIINKFIYFLIYAFLFLIVALTGERLAFIIFLFASLIIIFFFDFSVKKLFISSFLILSLLFSIYNLNPSFRLRLKEFANISTNLYESSYGRLWESAYLTYKANKIFGVGLKNYRYFCDNYLKPIDLRPESQYQLCSTHPHNFILEILAETGIVGFTIFFIFFYKLIIFLKSRIKVLKKQPFFNEYAGLAYGNILMLFVYIFPLKTSGSFFTTWNASFFWMNLGFALLLTKNNKI